MTSTYNRSQICKQAWLNAKFYAKYEGGAVRSHLSKGFKAAWAAAKMQVERLRAPRVSVVSPVVSRGFLATSAQVAYIAKLGGVCPAGTTKIQASAIIDELKAKRATRSTHYSFSQELYSPDEIRRLSYIRNVYGCIVD